MQGQSCDASLVIQIVRERLLADLKAAGDYFDDHTRDIARVTLESLTRNLAAELRARGFDPGSLTAPRQALARVRIECDGESAVECPIADFLRDNSEALEVSDVSALLDTGRLVLGGGAAPVSIITLIGAV